MFQYILCVASLFDCAALMKPQKYATKFGKHIGWKLGAQFNCMNWFDDAPPLLLLLPLRLLSTPCTCTFYALLRCFVHVVDTTEHTDTRSSTTTTSPITLSRCKTRSDRVTVPGRRTRIRLRWPVVRCKLPWDGD